jgi:cytochrome c-type biogenesis protein CcmH/NrfG
MFVIVLVSLTAYFNALSCGFVFDDRFQILDNPWITDIKYIPEIFSSDVWKFNPQLMSNYYRPLMYVIYMFDFHLFGLNPLGFHLVNVLLHAAVSVLVFAIAMKLLAGEFGAPSFPTQALPAFAAAILFATHPVHTEAVTWLAGLPDVSATFFCLLSLNFYIKSGNKTGGIYMLSVASFFLATLCKEPALMLPLILISYDFLFRKDKSKVLLLKRYIAFFIAAGVYLLLRFHALKGFAPAVPVIQLSGYQYIINVFPLFYQYLEKLILPVNLSFWRDFHPINSLKTVEGMMYLLIAVVYLIAIWLTRKKDKIVCFSLLVIVIPLLPSFYIRGITGTPFGERYLYFPSVGFAILGGWIFYRARRRFPRWQLIPVTVLLIVAGLYGTGTAMRNTVWKNNNSFFADALQKSGSSRFWMTAVVDSIHNANKALERGQIDEAIETYRYALTLKPDEADAHYKLGIAFGRKGLTEKAVEQYQMAIRLKPDFLDAHINLGNSFFVEGRIDNAIEEYKSALNISPDSVKANYNLGTAYKEKGLIDAAIKHLRAAAERAPAEPLIRQSLDEAYASKKSKK